MGQGQGRAHLHLPGSLILHLFLILHSSLMRFFKMDFKEIAFILLFSGLLKGVTAQVVQDPRFHGHIPEQCGEDASFCHSYCLSIYPGTVRAQCASDQVSCICTNANEQSVGVRFVLDRKPLPYTTTTTTTTPEPTPAFDYPPSGPVPELLNCDGSSDAVAVCNEFCIHQISAIRGFCNLQDKSCSCEGVPSSVVQKTPIPAVFEYQYRPPLPTMPPVTTPTPSIAIQQSFWTPITQKHPNYNPITGNTIQQQVQPPPQFEYQQFGGLGHRYNPQPQQPQVPYYFLPNPYQQPPMDYHYTYWNPMMPAVQEPEQSKDLFPAEDITAPNDEVETTSPANETASGETEPVVEEPTVPTVVDESSSGTSTQQAEIKNHKVEVRKKRSLLNSYPNVFNYGNFQDSCSLTSCLSTCTSSGFDSGKNCSPLCVDNACVCVCRPVTSSSSISAVVNSKVNQMVQQVFGSTAASSPPADFTSTSTSYGNGIVNVQTSSLSTSSDSDGLQNYDKEEKTASVNIGINPVGEISQEDFLNLFRPPPSLHR